MLRHQITITHTACPKSLVHFYLPSCFIKMDTQYQLSYMIRKIMNGIHRYSIT